MSIDFNNSNKGSRASDFFDSHQDLARTLDDASLNASGRREDDFVGSLYEKFDEWGIEMFLSDAQHSWLINIAER